MSELVCTAIITPKAGQADKVEELIAGFAAYVHAYEPDTIRYQLHREVGKDTPEFVMIETYKDQAALDTHMGSDQFKELGKKGREEGLLEKPIQIFVTQPVAGFASRDRGTLKM